QLMMTLFAMTDLPGCSTSGVCTAMRRSARGWRKASPRSPAGEVAARGDAGEGRAACTTLTVGPLCGPTALRDDLGPLRGASPQVRYGMHTSYLLDPDLICVLRGNSPTF
ncbi:MAG TPA: hypothetical protein VJY15_04375, partial [Candidatus Acidoferrum sp.]|nr:hypothetical protein [Candidatus Acidoferrum sp.]